MTELTAVVVGRTGYQPYSGIFLFLLIHFLLILLQFHLCLPRVSRFLVLLVLDTVDMDNLICKIIVFWKNRSRSPSFPSLPLNHPILLSAKEFRPFRPSEPFSNTFLASTFAFSKTPPMWHVEKVTCDMGHVKYFHFLGEESLMRIYFHFISGVMQIYKQNK